MGQEDDACGKPVTARPDDSRQLLQEIARQSPVGMAVIDRAGLFRLVNPAYCAIYGYRQEELLDHSFTMLFQPAQRERVLLLHHQCLAGVGDLSGDWDVVRRDGTLLNVKASSVCLPCADGQMCRVVYVLDNTERRRTELALRTAHRFTQSVLDGLRAHVCVIDHAGVIVSVNRAWRDFAAANSGSTAAVQEGANYLAVCEAAVRMGTDDAAEAGQFLTLLREAIAGRRKHFEFEYACHSPEEQRWFIVRVSRVEGNDPPSFVVAHDNVTALKQAQAALRRQAAIDDLTGVANRRHFMLALNTELERCRRQPALQSAVLSFDVDHFKQVNDTWGHAAGDALLRHITTVVGGHIRSIDVLGRMGGEEFAVLLPDTSLENAVALGKRLGLDIAQQVLSFGEHRIAATVSSGVTVLDAADANADAALARADRALYEAKNAGRNAIRWRRNE